MNIVMKNLMRPSHRQCVIVLMAQFEVKDSFETFHEGVNDPSLDSRESQRIECTVQKLGNSLWTLHRHDHRLCRMGGSGFASSAIIQSFWL